MIPLLRASALAFVALGIFAPSRALAAPIDDKPKVQASLVAERDAVVPGGQVSVALREVIRKGWHTYWRNPGDSGEPTSITWHLPPGWKAGEIAWPYPTRLPVGPLMDFGYSDEAALLVDIAAPPDATPGTRVHVTADAMWLVCAEVCIPEQATLALDLNVAASPPPASAARDFFAAARAKIPPQVQWPAHYSATDSEFALSVESSARAAARPRDAFFFPYTDGYVANAAPQHPAFGGSGLTLATKPGWRLSTPAKRAAAGPLGGVLVLTNAAGTNEALALTATPGAVAIAPAVAGIGFFEALLFAFLGGLILNLMPCVLPVLSMKALALARSGGGAARAHKEVLAYGAGVVLAFAGLGGLLVLLRAGGEAVGWGFQLQEPVVVAALALLIFAVGLNLSGLFEVDASLAGFGQRFVSQGGVVGNLLTGALAVAVAAPCTAPFMGAAMGFALTQPAPIALAVFVALSLGFAAPFVVLGFWPAALSLLPKPGAWMVRLRQVLALPMYATALWLGWVLSLEAGPGGVVVLAGAALALAVALRAYEAAKHAQGRARQLSRIAFGVGIVAALALLPLADTGKQAPAPQLSVLPSQPYSAALLTRLRAEGRPVFVNATAAWCITCLVNEQVALSREGLADIFARHGVAYLVADWTNRDAEVTALLAQYGRSGVPLYLYFPPHAGEPVVLPQILTENAVRSAIESQHSALSH